MATYVVSIKDAPSGTYTKVKKLIGDPELWDYDKPEFTFEGDQDLLDDVLAVEGVIFVSGDIAPVEEAVVEEAVGEEAVVEEAEPIVDPVMVPPAPPEPPAPEPEPEPEPTPEPVSEPEPAPPSEPPPPAPAHPQWTITAGTKTITVEGDTCPPAEFWAGRLGAPSASVMDEDGTVVSSWPA